MSYLVCRIQWSGTLSVTGALGKDGAENVLAIYAPFGDMPMFHVRMDGREAPRSRRSRSWCRRGDQSGSRAAPAVGNEPEAKANSGYVK